MTTTTAARGGVAVATLALATTVLAPLALGQAASAGEVVAGYVLQTSPKPNYIYNGLYGSYFSSQLVNNGEPHTVITVDLYGLVTAAGYNAIDSISIVDAGNNQYVGSPGADIDLFTLQGIDPATAITYAYNGPNAQHINETSAVLGSRVGLLDTISGDQDYNSLHFVSLGKLGALSASFLVPSGGAGGGSGGGSGGGGGGDGGPGQMGGGGGGGGTPTWSNYLLIQPGMKLTLSEAGSSEGYLIKIQASMVPAPGAAAGLLGLLGLGGRRRRA